MSGSTKVSIDGQIVDADHAHVSVFDRGFLYGDSVFEVWRTYGGVPFADHEHLERLVRSAGQVLIPMPATIEQIKREATALHDATGNTDSYLRVVVTRGSGPLTYDPSTAKDPLRVIIAKPVPVLPRTLYEDGVAVVTVQATRPTDGSQAAGAKASNYLANLLAAHHAKERGGYEAILVARNGQVLEGASSNVFVVRDGRIRTPRPEAGILAGITRATVIAAAQRAGVTVEEEALFPADLYEADEVFITSSIREVVPVVKVDGESIGAGRPGPMVNRLHAAYRDVVYRRG